MSFSVRVYYPDYNEEHRHVLMQFAKGIPNSTVHPVNDYEPSDVAVIYGGYKYAFDKTLSKKRVMDGQKEAGKEFIIVDSGYIRRDRYYSVAVGGLNAQGRFYNENSPPDRFNALGIELKPLQHRPEGKIILAGQVPWDCNVQDVDYMGWVLEAFTQLCDMFGRDRIVFRPHPKVKNEIRYPVPEQFFTQNEWLEQDLEQAGLLVCYNSNSAVDAALSGVAVAVLGPGSVAAPMAFNSLSEICETGAPEQSVSFNREQTLHNIAYAQWTPEEMAEGKTWAHLGPHLCSA